MIDERQGAPLRCTPEVSAKICAAIRDGHTFEDSARLAGISKTTFHRWMRRGKREGELSALRSFRVDVEKATLDARVTLVSIIWEASKRDWRAAAWFLERRYPEEYGKQTRVEHSGPNGAPVPLSATLARVVVLASNDNDERSTAGDVANQPHDNVNARRNRQ
ncbi:MAG: hypothetical protein U0165_03550 [Polyangiaceae bacterium]